METAQPFVRFLIPLIAGIFSSLFINDRSWIDSGNLSFFLCSIFVGCLLIAWWWRKKPDAASPIIYLALFSLGMLTTTLKHGAFQKQVHQFDEANYDAYVLEIGTLGEKRKTTVRYDAQAISLRLKGQWHTSQARVVLSMADQSKYLEPGTRLLVKGRPLQRPFPPRNPKEFDYRKYLERKGVAWTLYLPQDSYALLSKARSKGVGAWPLRFSAWADGVLQANLPNRSAYGLVKAMVLARRDDLGADLLNNYIQAGAVHVLAVSGLHVGIIFLLLSAALGGLSKRPRGRFLYLGLIVLILTFYALITGLSPSVVRASLMCATFALSQTFKRSQNGVNTLALSAFVILLFDPLALFSVGFQLSYAAVLGIMLFYPLFKEYVDSKFRIVKWLGQITLISLAAQVFTFPLSIYYFHQFPTYFLLVNPIVIGLTPLLIYGTLAILAFSWFGWAPLNYLLTFLTEGVAWMMNRAVGLPKLLPNYLLENLHLDFVEILILFMTMLVAYDLIRSREVTMLRPLLLCCLVFSTYAMAQSMTDFNTSGTAFHFVPKHTVLSITKGQRAYLVSNPEFRYDTLAYNFHLKNYFVTHGIREVRYHSLPDKSTIRPLRLDLPQFPVYFDARVSPGEKSWVVVRQKRFPRIGTLPNLLRSHFILSPELGFKTKAQWHKLLLTSENQVTDPALLGAVEVP